MARGPQALAERSAPEQRRRLAPTAKTAKLLGLLVVPVAVLATGITVVAASYSSFSAVTSSPSMSWTTGSVVLANDGVAGAAFTVTGLKPGSTGSHCINVTSSGSLPSSVKLYAAGATTTKLLSTYVNLVITQAPGSAAPDCTGYSTLTGSTSVFSGTLLAFGGLGGFNTGAGTWTTTGTAPEVHAYRIDYSVLGAATNDQQAGNAAVTFTWEAQNV